MHIIVYITFDVTNCPAKLLWNVLHFSVEMWSLFSWCKLMENNNEVVVQVRFVLIFGNEVLYSRYCKPPFTARVKSVMPAKSPAILPRWKWYWLGCECVCDVRARLWPLPPEILLRPGTSSPRPCTSRRTVWRRTQNLSFSLTTGRPL